MAADDFSTLFARGRVLLQIEDARALETLQRAVDASQNAPKSEQVAAVLALSRASQKWQSRDDATEVLARGLKQNDAKEIRDALAPLLVEGLPQNASENTLQSLSEIGARGQWTLQKSTFSFPALEVENSKFARNHTFDILQTRGELFVSGKNADGAPRLWRTPKLYAAYSPLPATLQMNRAVYGYVKTGEKWRQVARVLYANVDGENARAQKICDVFLRVWCSFQLKLKRDNLYANVTTIWLSRESALWPQSENTPNWNAGAQLDSAPAEMILFRTGETRSDAEWLREIAHEYSHIALPPFAGYKMPLEPFGNGVLGESLLMLWALNAPPSFFALEQIEAARPQLRVHVSRHAIPAWKSWLAHDPRAEIGGGDETARRKLQGLTLWVERVYGAPTLRFALSQLNENPENRRQAALAWAQRRNADGKVNETVLSAEDLRRVVGDSISITAQNDVSSRLPLVLRLDQTIWLGGALRSSKPMSPEISPDALANRAPLKLRANERASGWIYIPRGAKSLRVTSSTRFVADGWKTSFANNAVVLKCEDKTGWQRLAIRATHNFEIGAARFE